MFPVCQSASTEIEGQLISSSNKKKEDSLNWEKEKRGKKGNHLAQHGVVAFQAIRRGRSCHTPRKRKEEGKGCQGKGGGEKKEVFGTFKTKERWKGAVSPLQ